MTRTCRHEPAVLAAARASASTTVADDVQAHLAACEDCRLSFALVVSLQDEHAQAMSDARVPSAGQVWWRAELRARQDAAAAVARPITLATGLAAAAVVGVVASLIGVIGWWARAWLTTTLARLSWPDAATQVTWSGGTWLAVGLALAMVLVATPLVLYVASREE
jgi:hypothetical protein